MDGMVHLVDVAVNGTVVANWGLSYWFCRSLDSISYYSSGDVVDFSFTSGAWDSEITFDITDPSGSQLGTYGPTPTSRIYS